MKNKTLEEEMPDPEFAAPRMFPSEDAEVMGSDEYDDLIYCGAD